MILKFWSIHLYDQKDTDFGCNEDRCKIGIGNNFLEWQVPLVPKNAIDQKYLHVYIHAYGCTDTSSGCEYLPVNEHEFPKIKLSYDPNIFATPSAVYVQPQNSTTVRLLGGSPPFNIVSNDLSIASVILVSETIVVNGLSEGNTTIVSFRQACVNQFFFAGLHIF